MTLGAIIINIISHIHPKIQNSLLGNLTNEDLSFARFHPYKPYNTQDPSSVVTEEIINIVVSFPCHQAGYLGTISPTA